MSRKRSPANKRRPREQAFKVVWELDLVMARTPRAAAEQAFKIIQEPGTECTVFQVRDQSGKVHDIDLSVAEEDTSK